MSYIINYKLNLNNKHNKKIIKNILLFKFFFNYFKFSYFIKKKKKKIIILLAAPYRYKIAKHKIKLLSYSIKYNILNSLKDKIYYINFSKLDILHNLIHFVSKFNVNKKFLKNSEFFINFTFHQNYLI
jgi:hypothetical protein